MLHIHDHFLRTAQRFPEAEALSFGGRSLTYAECAAQVKLLAQGLQAHLPQRARVAINAAKSIDTIVMMLACLRAGLTYVPIDPSSPIGRRRFIVGDCSARALALDERAAREWAAETGTLAGMDLIITFTETQRLSERQVTLQQLIEQAHGHGAKTQPTDDDLAYILYTSGSTGDPKGVMISHRNAAAFVEWGSTYFDVHPGDRVAVHAPLHFDLPVFDLYVGLAQGATVCPIDERTVLFPEALLRFLRQNRISVLYAVPSALTALVNRSTLAEGMLPALRLLLYAGEEFHPTPLAKLMNVLPQTRVFNLYGPIETNVVTAFEVLPQHLAYQRIPIGYPISNTCIVLADADGQLVKEVGREGEILVSGPSISPGYVNQPELTRRARIEVRDRERSWLCYRTGDFAHWDEQGLLHFLGRRDALIKTRGFRVDLGDVESTLMAHGQIAEAAVVAQPHPDYTNLLYAFIVLKQGALLSEADALAWCRENLPSYMVPAQITFRDHLPKTSTGKIARRHLLDTQPNPTRDAHEVHPSTTA